MYFDHKSELLMRNGREIFELWSPMSGTEKVAPTQNGISESAALRAFGHAKFGFSKKTLFGTTALVNANTLVDLRPRHQMFSKFGFLGKAESNGFAITQKSIKAFNQLALTA